MRIIEIKSSHGCRCPTCTLRMSEAGFRAVSEVADRAIRGQLPAEDALKAIAVIAHTSHVICADVIGQIRAAARANPGMVQ